MSWNLWLGGSEVDDHRAKQVKAVSESGADVVGLQERDARTPVTGTPRPWPDVADDDGPCDHADVVTRFAPPRP